MFTPQLADKIESLLRDSISVREVERIGDGEEFFALLVNNRPNIGPQLMKAIQLSDAFDINFAPPSQSVTLYLKMEEDGDFEVLCDEEQ